MADALVSIHERMVHYQRETQRRSLFRQSGIEVVSVERHARLGQGGIQGFQVTDTRSAAGLCDNPPMQVEDLVKCQIAHRLTPNVDKARGFCSERSPRLR